MNNGCKALEGASMMKVIETTLTRRGDGVDTPIRIVRQYWSPEGELLAEMDPCPDHERSIKVLTDAILWALGEKGDIPLKWKPSSAAIAWRKELRLRACGMLPRVMEPAK